MKSILKWIGAALIFLFSVMLIRTFTFGEGAVNVKSVPLLEIDEEGFAERFAGGLRIPTVAYTD
ncbi:MAG TPA: peptidase M20, partial [Candidatus Marinimicrobia bacterium]|nr:peptidase M20 [Candidatus Neomarinimicrobiota bacterium]